MWGEGMIDWCGNYVIGYGRGKDGWIDEQSEGVIVSVGEGVKIEKYRESY